MNSGRTILMVGASLSISIVIPFTRNAPLDIRLWGFTIEWNLIGDPPFKKGPTKKITIEYKDFYKDYCKLMGWNPDTGYPLKETLELLDLDFVTKDLY